VVARIEALERSQDELLDRFTAEVG